VTTFLFRNYQFGNVPLFLDGKIGNVTQRHMREYRRSFPAGSTSSISSSQAPLGLLSTPLFRSEFSFSDHILSTITVYGYGRIVYVYGHTRLRRIGTEDGEQRDGICSLRNGQTHGISLRLQGRDDS